MDFKKEELDVIYQYATSSKEKTIADLKEILPRIKQEQLKTILESTIEKLLAMQDKECVKFMLETKAHFLKERDKSIRQQQYKKYDKLL